MMSFCKKSVNSFLGLNSLSTENSYKCMAAASSSSLACGLGLINATADTHKTPNVVESAIFKSLSSPPPPPPGKLFSGKKDPGGIGFIDDIGGGVDGLMSCTESLGFESSDERRVDDEIELCSSSTKTTTTTRVKWRNGGEKREMKEFPPPISSLNHNGRPSFFLRPMRTDGRLELREIRIDRPEILQAYRQDGRLTMHFVRDDEDIEEGDENDQEQEEEEEKCDDQLEKEKEQKVTAKEEGSEEVEGKNIGEGDDGIEQWRLQVTGQGLRRCHHMLSHQNHHHPRHHHHHHGNHHHDLHGWGQHCVTTS